MYANQTVVTDLNLNHVWVTQAELLLKDTFVKVSFMFVTIFLDMKTLREKTLLTGRVPSILK